MSDKNYNFFLGRARVLAVFAFILALAYFARPTPTSVSIGFVFMAAGQAIRFWSAGHLRKTVELITSGPYRYTRNPLYLGRLLILTGIGVMCVLPYHLHWVILGFGYLVFFGYYFPRKERVEPARLLRTHGEPYEKYNKAVPALFPRLTPWPEGSTMGWSSDRMLANREQWMVLGVIALTLAMLYKAYSTNL